MVYDITDERFYYAIQGEHDEFRTLASLFYCMGIGERKKPEGVLTLVGPPSSGKTTALEIFAENILGLGCDRFLKAQAAKGENVYSIKGFPIVIDNNSSLVDTVFTNVLKMDGRRVLYIDEVNFYDSSVQKVLGSMFDYRHELSILERNDGHISDKVLKASDPENLFIVTAYNPDKRRPFQRTFEQSFASRFIEAHYENMPGKLKSYMHLLNMDEEAHLDQSLLKKRGIIMGDNYPIFLEQVDGEWHHNGQIYEGSMDGIVTYTWYDTGKNLALPRTEISVEQYVSGICGLFDDRIRRAAAGSLNDEDKSALNNQNGLEYGFDYTPLDMRITNFIFAEYYLNKKAGNYSESKLQAIANDRIVTNLLKGELGYHQVGDNTAKDFVGMVLDYTLYGSKSNTTI